MITPDRRIMCQSSGDDRDRILWSVLDAILCVTWFIYWSHRRRGDDSNFFLTTITYSSQSNSKLYVRKNNYVPNPPVELAQCNGHCHPSFLVKYGVMNESIYWRQYWAAQGWMSLIFFDAINPLFNILVIVAVGKCMHVYIFGEHILK